MTEVEAIERATLAAVAPPASTEIGGWLLGFDGGAIGRAKCATPLHHDGSASNTLLDEIESAFRARDLAPLFRVADVAGLAKVHEALADKGYKDRQPTLVKTGSSRVMREVSSETAELVGRPDEAWAGVFLGQGFDPVDGASRVNALTRGQDAIYAQVRDSGRTVAVGVAAFGFGWMSIHGMRTEISRRGEGLAGRILAALAGAGQARGIERAFLQVEEPNLSARALYRRAGLTPIWRYHYWSR